MGLTKTEIDNFTYRFELKSGKADYRYDDSLAGFAVRVYPSGKKTFVLRYRTQQHQSAYFTIGQYGHLTLAQARQFAIQRLSDIALGSNPAESKKAEKLKIGFSDFCKVYIERHAKPNKKTWKDDLRSIDNELIAAFGANKTLDKISREMISAFHHKIGTKKKHPYAANRHLELIKKIFECAIDWGYLPLDYPNPARKIKSYKEQKRERYILPEEMPLLAAEIAKEQNIYLKAVLWLYLLTGIRKRELLALRWEQVDLNKCEINLLAKTSKNKKNNTLPLSSLAQNLFSVIPKQKDNPFVFCGKHYGEHLVEINKSWNRIRERANLKDVRIHDLRRTLGSWLAQAGFGLPQIGAVLTHSDMASTQIYTRFGKAEALRPVVEHQSKALEPFFKL